MSAPGSVDRVLENTPEEVNRRIRRQTEIAVGYFAQHPTEIAERLEELDREWDLERALEANAASLALAGSALGILVNRRWSVLPLLVGGFLLQHAIQGWCPPLSVLRRLGVRTPQEIEAERYALKALRGDFGQVTAGPGGQQRALAATGRF